MAEDLSLCLCCIIIKITQGHPYEKDGGARRIFYRLKSSFVTSLGCSALKGPQQEL